MRRLDSSAVLAVILAIYLGLTLATAFTKVPWQDEAWFASPAWNLAQHGFLGTTILDPASSTWKGVVLTGIDRHTYWILPLSMLVNAAVFRLLGFGAVIMRTPAILFGLLTLLSWRTILRRLGAPASTVALALLFIAVDYHFQLQAADGRMDAQTSGLGYCALAAYLVLRERRLPLAIALSQSLAAAATFTHPNGALLALLLAVTTLYFDAKRLRPALAAIVPLPYLAIAAGWSLYIAQAPAQFRAQFLGNAADRGPTIVTPLAAIKLEIAHRYMDNFGLAAWSTIAGRVNLIPLLVMLAGVAVCLAVREIRTHSGFRLLLLWTGLTVFYLTFFEGLKTLFYLIYLTPLYCVLCAIAAGWLWQHRPRSRVPVFALLTMFVLLQFTRTAAIAARRPWQTTYTPAVRYLQQHYSPATFVMGDGSLMFGLGPDWNLLDDFRLGYNSGKRPDVIVIDDSWEDRIGMLRQLHPEIWEHTQRVLAGYREVYNRPHYRIFERVR